MGFAGFLQINDGSVGAAEQAASEAWATEFPRPDRATRRRLMKAGIDPVRFANRRDITRGGQLPSVAQVRSMGPKSPGDTPAVANATPPVSMVARGVVNGLAGVLGELGSSAGAVVTGSFSPASQASSSSSADLWKPTKPVESSVTSSLTSVANDLTSLFNASAPAAVNIANAFKKPARQPGISAEEAAARERAAAANARAEALARQKGMPWWGWALIGFGGLVVLGGGTALLLRATRRNPGPKRTTKSRVHAFNSEGLTLRRWLSAASFGKSKRLKATKSTRAAWRRGEDPTEWAARR